MHLRNKITRQAITYVVVGLASNITLYILYLLSTTAGMGHKTAMTTLFLIGALLTFFLNKRLTFCQQGNFHAALVKYILVYSLAYLLNLTSMLIFVDRLSFPHQIVQGLMIFIIAIMLFFLQRYWVFRQSELA